MPGQQVARRELEVESRMVADHNKQIAHYKLAEDHKQTVHNVVVEVVCRLGQREQQVQVCKVAGQDRGVCKQGVGLHVACTLVVVELQVACKRVVGMRAVVSPSGNNLMILNLII